MFPSISFFLRHLQALIDTCATSIPPEIVLPILAPTIAQAIQDGNPASRHAGYCNSDIFKKTSFHAFLNHLRPHAPCDMLDCVAMLIGC